MHYGMVIDRFAWELSGSFEVRERNGYPEIIQTGIQRDTYTIDDLHAVAGLHRPYFARTKLQPSPLDDLRGNYCGEEVW